MAKQYPFGRSKERLVAQNLKRHGAKPELSPGSRGITDIKAPFRSGKSWRVQVKATRAGKPAPLSPKEVGRLKSSATRSDATPVIAYVKGKKISYYSAKTGQKLKP